MIHIIIAYIAIIIGVFLEGEMIMISSVIAAHHGYLNLWLVVVIEKYIIGFLILLGIIFIIIKNRRGKKQTKKSLPGRLFFLNSIVSTN